MLLSFCLFSLVFLSVTSVSPTAGPTRSPTTARPTRAPTVRPTLCPTVSGQTTVEYLMDFDTNQGMPCSDPMGETYIFFNFTVINTPYSSIPTSEVVISNTQCAFTPEFVNISYSGTNIITTTRNIMTMTTYNASRFGFYGLKVRAIYSTVWLTINVTRNNNLVLSKEVNASAGSWTFVNINRGNLDKLTIGCKQPDPALGTCSDVAYEDFDLCYRYYPE